MGTGEASQAHSPDPLHGSTPPDLHWTTANVGEGFPGVLTPLTWTAVGPAIGPAIREAAYAVGAFARHERPDGSPPGANIFFGRLVMSVELIAALGDRMPGTSGPEVVAGLIGQAPETLRFSPTKQRYPLIAVKFPLAFLSGPRKLHEMATEYQDWWTTRVARAGDLDRESSHALFVDAVRRVRASHQLQGIGALVVVQPVHDLFHRVVTWLERPELRELAGVPGGPEFALITDLWAASRGQLTIEQLRNRYGYHGPREGELTSPSWREDDAPLRRLVAQYATREDNQNPVIQADRRAADHRRLTRDALNELPPHKRLALRLALSLVRRHIPLRGRVKTAMVQSVDGLRAAARRLGTHLVAEGHLASPNDVFFLTVDELADVLPPNVAELVAGRRQLHQRHQTLTLPEAFRGEPSPVRIKDEQNGRSTSRTDTISVQGVGVSSGIVEGIVRVVIDPAFTDVEPDEILVAPYTDPSWSSIMYISSALVVDIGGALSHASVVARELGIPCVVNTRNGSRTLKTGDTVRVDGDTGAVTVLGRPTD